MGRTSERVGQTRFTRLLGEPARQGSRPGRAGTANQAVATTLHWTLDVHNVWFNGTGAVGHNSKAAMPIQLAS
jgi:hypothetical protein